METVPGGSSDRNSVSYDAEGTASTVVDRVLLGYIAASGEMQPASAGLDCSLEVHRSLYRPSYQSVPRRCWHEAPSRCYPSCRLGARLGGARHEVAWTLYRVERVLAVLCDSAAGVVTVDGSDLQARRCRRQTSVLCLGNILASFPSPSSTTSRVAFVRVLGSAVTIDRALNLVCAGVQSRGRWIRDGRASGWASVHGDSRIPTLDGAWVYRYRGNRGSYDQGTAFAGEAEKAFVVSFRGVKMSTLPGVVVGCETHLAWISSGNREMGTGFESSAVWQMKASGGWSALACRSRAWPTALDLCCVLEPPRARASMASAMTSAGALGCGRGCGRDRGEAWRRR